MSSLFVVRQMENCKKKEKTKNLYATVDWTCRCRTEDLVEAGPIGCSCTSDFDLDLKEAKRWNVATYHLDRAVGVGARRQGLWVETALSNTRRSRWYNYKLRLRCLHGGRVNEDDEYSEDWMEKYRNCEMRVPRDEQSDGMTLRRSYERGDNGRDYPYRRYRGFSLNVDAVAASR